MQHTSNNHTPHVPPRRPWFTPTTQACVRIPLLPLDAARRSKPGYIMKTAAHDPLFHEAIYAASNVLADMLIHARNGSCSPRKLQRLQQSLLRYYLRMASRTTPFGLFAGIAEVKIDARTQISLREREAYRHHTRPDMKWLLALIETFEQDEAIRPFLVFTYQPVLTGIGPRYYFEYIDRENNLTQASLGASEQVNTLIRLTRGGLRYDLLIQQLAVEGCHGNMEEARKLVEKCITYRLLISSLTPPLLGAEPLMYVIQQFANIPSETAHDAVRKLQELATALSRYDQCPPGYGEALLAHIRTSTAGQFGQVPQPVSFAIDTAMALEETPTLQQSVADDAALLAELLFKLSPHPVAMSPLLAYRLAFIERYGSYRKVPLLEMLSESGLGSPYAKHRPRKNVPQNISWKETYSSILEQQALEAWRSHQRVIRFDDAMIRRLTNPDIHTARFPSSIDIGIHIAAKNQQRLNTGDYLVALSPFVGAQAAGRSIGRFAGLLGAHTSTYLQTLAQPPLQSNMDAELSAELTYIPTDKHKANVIIRPLVTEYELPVACTPIRDAEHTLSLDDLLVDANEERFRIWSATHKKPVNITHTHMLQPYSSLTAVRFLTDAAHDGLCWFNPFSWANAERLPFLPRIMYNRLVLSLASWRFDSTDIFKHAIPHTRRTSLDVTAIYAAVQAWRQKEHVPRRIYLADEDNYLLLDLLQPAHTAELHFAATARGKKRVLRLYEVLPSMSTGWLRGPTGTHASEFSLQLISNPDLLHARQSVSGVLEKLAQPIKRQFVPGSEWLYCKFYIPPSQHDLFLGDYLKTLLAHTHENITPSAWFFIRYLDTDHHIRLRFKAVPEQIRLVLLPLITSWAVGLEAAGLIQRFSIDTYDAEVERYGGPEAIIVAEKIFCIESDMLHILLGANNRQTFDSYTKTALCVLTTYKLLHAFGLTDAQQMHWIEKQWGARKRPHIQRQLRTSALQLLEEYAISAPEAEQLRKICEPYFDRIATCADQYHTLSAQNRLYVPLPRILTCFVHMHVNRMLGIEAKHNDILLVLLQVLRARVYRTGHHSDKPTTKEIADPR